MRLRFLGVALAAFGLVAGPAVAQHHGGRGPGPGPGGWHGPHPWGAREIDRWHGGFWRHDWHGGRFGWWWVVGPSWYFYPAPVYPYPNPYVPPSIPAPTGPMWYWCPAPAGYYPYVAACSTAWQAVPPR